MGRGLALVAEVLEGGHEAASEEGLPLAVHGDTGREGILRREEPAREREAVGRGVLGQGGQEGRHGGRDLLLRAEVLAAMVEEGRTRVGGGTFAHHERGLAARDLLAEIGEGLGVDGQFRRGLEEALTELRQVVRGVAREHGLDLGGVSGGGGLGVGRYGDAEVSDRSGVVLLEEHLERPAGGEVGRLIEMEDRDMVLPVSAEHLPSAGHLAVERRRSVVLLAVGLGGLGLGRGFGRLRGRRRVADAVLFLVVGRGGVVELQTAIALPRLEFAEEEAAERAFVVGEAGTVVGEQRMRGDFDADGEGAFDGAIEGQVVDVALRDVTTAEDEAVGLHVEGGQGGLELAGAEDLPLRRALALGVEPGAETLFDRGAAARELAFEGFFGGTDALGVVGLPGLEVGGRDVVGRLVGVVEQRHHREVIGMEHRIVLMRMALGAVQGEAHPGGSRGADAVDHGVEAVFVRIGAAFFVEHRVAVEARGDEVVGRGAGQQVAGELPDAELVVGQVRVEGLHDPIAVGPDGAGTVLLEAVGVGVAGEVEPATGPAFTVAGRGEQAVDEFLVSVGGLVVDEGIGFFGRRRHAGEIERHAAHEGVAIGFGRRLEAGLFEAGLDERIDGMDAALRQRRLLGSREGPVRLIDSALGDPSAEDRLILGGDWLLGLGRRHHVIRVVGEDAVHDFALVGLAGDDRGLAGFSFAVRGFRKVEAELTFARMFVHAVAGEAVLGQDRPDLTVEVDGIGPGVGAGEQGGEVKARHGAWVRARELGGY